MAKKTYETAGEALNDLASDIQGAVHGSPAGLTVDRLVELIGGQLDRVKPAAAKGKATKAQAQN